jgi:hypothetical protein
MRTKDDSHRRLWIEHIDNRKEESVENGEEEISTPANAVNQHRGDHYDEKVPQPVRNSRESVGLSTSLERVDLGRVQPRQRKPGGTEEGDVGEETNSSTLGGLFVTRDKTGEDQNHGQALTDGTVKEELAASDTFDEEHRSTSEKRVDDHVDTTEQERQVLSSTDGVAEQNREVVDDSVAARKLLHELRTGTEHHTTEVLGLTTSEQDGEGSLLTETASSLDRVENDVAFELDLGVISGLGLESG